MTQIIIELPRDRLQPGTLWLKDDRDRILAGPFPALGKADGITATRYGNRFRTPARPYGDTPLGEYRVLEVRQSGPDSLYANEPSYGPHGVIVLEPISGDAAVAQIFGRTEFLIQGGDLGINGGLQPTNGSIRLSNSSMAMLIASVRPMTGSLACRCIEAGRSNGGSNNREEFFLCAWFRRCLEIVRPHHNHSSHLVAPDNGYDEGDPPLRSPNLSTSEPTSPIRRSRSEFTPSPSPSDPVNISVSIDSDERTVEIRVFQDNCREIAEIDIPLPGEAGAVADEVPESSSGDEACGVEGEIPEPFVSQETNSWDLECETETPSLY